MDSTPAAATDSAPKRPTPRTDAPITAQTPAPESNLDIERGPNWLFVRVKHCRPGDPEAISLAQRVSMALDQHFIYRVVLELDDATLPCDRLIEELRTLDQWIQHHHGVLRLCGLSTQYARRLDRAHLTSQFPLYHDREEAVWAGPHHCQPR